MKQIEKIIKRIRKNFRCLTAKKACDELKVNDGIIIDVRETPEVLQHPIKNTIHVPRGVLEMKMSTMYPNTDQIIYLHCASGIRATFAGEQLHRIGYKNINIIISNINEISSVFNK